MLSHCYQDAFYISREVVIEILAQQLKDLLKDPTYEEQDKLDLCAQEKRNDISRAFSFLLYHAKLHQEEIITSATDTVRISKHINEIILFPYTDISKS